MFVLLLCFVVVPWFLTKSHVRVWKESRIFFCFCNGFDPLRSRSGRRFVISTPDTRYLVLKSRKEKQIYREMMGIYRESLSRKQTKRSRSRKQMSASGDGATFCAYLLSPHQVDMWAWATYSPTFCFMALHCCDHFFFFLWRWETIWEWPNIQHIP